MQKKNKPLVIRWRPQPRQLAFLRACGLAHWFDHTQPGDPAARLIGYGGAAGGGKSDALLIVAVIACLTYAGAQVGYFRRTYPELEGPGGVIQRSQTLLAELVLAKIAKYQSQFHRWVFANGSVLAFCHAEEESSVNKYQSLQFDVILIDEGTHFTEGMIQYLLTRNRLTVNMPKPIFAIATNPGSIGHHWFKRLFVDSGPSETVNAAILETKPVTTVFIPAKLADNPALERRDPEYRLTLESLPEHLRMQLLEGRWDSFSGQVFAEFDPVIHVVKPFPIPSHWRRWRSNDPGFSEPFSWHWLACDEDGNVYIYREFTRASTDPKLTYSEQALKVTELSVVGTEVPGATPEQRYNEQSHTYEPMAEDIDMTITGMDAFVKHPESGKQIIDYYEEGGVRGCVRPVHGSGARAQMAAVMHEYLKPVPGPDGKPTAKLRIFSTCRRLLDTLPMLTADENRPEQVAESSIDHWYQCAGYGVQAHHAQMSKPVKAPPTEADLLSAHKRKLANRIRLERSWT